MAKSKTIQLRRLQRLRQRRRRNGQILSLAMFETPATQMSPPTTSPHETAFTSDYLVQYCNKNWASWTQAMNDELLRLIRENFDSPTEENKTALANLEDITAKFEKVSKQQSKVPFKQYPLVA